jgi:hypothetical protein
MNSKLSIINPVSYPEWDSIIQRNSLYSVFHSSAWVKVLSDTYRYKPQFFIRFKESNIESLTPLMTVHSWLTGKRAVSLPFSDFCPIIYHEEDAYLQDLAYIKKYGDENHWKYFELRSNVFPKSIDMFASTFYLHDLMLTRNESEMFSQFSSSTRRNINLAGNKGVTIERTTGERELEQYYKLHCQTRKRLGVPPQPFIFFENLHKHFFKKDNGFILLATSDKELIGGMVFLHFGNKAYWKFSASNYKYRALKANNLLLWEGIKWYARNGFDNLNFGRTDLPHKGLRDFKLGWNATEKLCHYYRFDLRKNRSVQNKNETNGKMSVIIKKCPEIFLRYIGKSLYKHVA